MSTKKQREQDYKREWKSRIDAGIKSRGEYETYWKRHTNFYKNYMWQNTDEKVRDDIATVNLVYPLVSIIQETTYNKNPYIYITPTRPEFAEGAKVLEFLVNHLWYDLRINKQIRRAIKNAVLTGLAPVELGFSGRYDESGNIKPNDMPYVKSHYPEDFVTDSSTTTFDDEESLWRAFLRKVSYQSFRQMYPDAAKELKSKLQEKQKNSVTIDRAEKLWPDGVAPWTRVEYWQIQDLLSNHFYFMHNDLPDFLDVVPNVYNLEGFLSEVLVFNEVPNTLWPMSDVLPIETQQRELNKMRTFMLRHWKKIHPIYLYDKSILEEEDINRIIGAEDVEFIPVSDMNPERLRLLEQPKLQGDFYQHEATIKNDFREITGISEYYRGSAVPGTKTAYETAQVQAGTGVRLDGHSRATTDFVENIARKLVQIVKDFYTLPIVARIVGPDGALGWREFSRWDIQAEVDVRVHLGSMRPPDKEVNRMLAPQFYQMMRQEPLIDPRWVVSKTLEMWGDPAPDSHFVEGIPAEPMTPNDRGGGANVGANATQGRLRMMTGARQ